MGEGSLSIGLSVGELPRRKIHNVLQSFLITLIYLVSISLSISLLFSMYYCLIYSNYVMFSNCMEMY